MILKIASEAKDFVAILNFTVYEVSGKVVYERLTGGR